MASEERKTLPQRSTRGKRIQVALEDEGDADEEFWNQEFFAEEQVDEDYQSEPEQEDVVDTDFDEEESEESEEGEDVAEKPKRKALRPPGAPPARPAKAAATKPPQPARRASTASAAPSPTTPASPSQQDLDLLSAPTLRKSTQRKSAAAVAERLQAEAAKPKRQRVANAEATRQLTQEELLAEAARTELYNLADLRVLQAREEETKRRAVVVKHKYMGPLVRYRSYAVPLPVAAMEQQQQQQQQQQQHVSQEQPAAAPAPGDTGPSAANEVSAAHASVLPSTSAAGAAEPEARQQTTDTDVVMADAPSTAPEASSSPAAGVHSAAASAPAESLAGSTAVTGTAAATGTPAAAAATDTEAAAAAAVDTAAAAAAAAADAAGTAAAATAPQPAAVKEPDPAAEAGAAAAQTPAPQSKTVVPQEERTTLMLCNMKAPPRWLRARRAPQPPPRPLCAITGQPARYCDPLTGQFYATTEAFRELRRRGGHPLPDAASKPALRKGKQAAHGVTIPRMQQQQPALEHTEDVMALLLDFAHTQP